MWFVTDPVNKLPSVSLTILIVAFTAVLVAGSLEMAGVVKSTSLFSEVFYSAVALYFGRRFSSNGKVFSSEKAQEIEKKLES